jgi:hypothetical protein
MKPIVSKEELEGHRSDLCKWRSPAEFVRVVDELMSKVGSLQFFTDTKAAFGRDAWVAARLASVFEADEVRLGPDRWPDFETRANGTLRQYEITEADLEKRRRGDEYREAGPQGTSEWKMDPVENWIERAEEAPSAIQRVAIAKARKGYSRSARLVIYLNIADYDIRQKEIEAAMADSTEPAKEAFDQVWVLWKRQLYLLWEAGQQQGLIVPLSDRQSRLP